MEITIREEKPTDFKAVFALIKQAFENEVLSDHKEHFLVERIRESAGFVPELSLVAEKEGQIVGHILLSKIQIDNGQLTYPSLVLAPVSVLPDFHGRGIGGKLIKEGHCRAQQLGFKSAILLGHENYYPRFGYERADKFGIEFPMDVPKENCMAIALAEKGLEGVSGTVVFPGIFFEKA